MSSKDKSRKRQLEGDGDGEAANDPPQVSASGANMPNDRPLTFRPAFDDRDQLTTFLKGVFDKHLMQRGTVMGLTRPNEGMESGPANAESRALMPPPAPVGSYGRAVAAAPQLFGISTMPTGAVGQLPVPTETRTAETTGGDTPSTTKRQPRRRSRSGNNASLLRARSIDFHAPDPEEQAPPNETEDERRRRKERINGRRKRAKKMIEIDYLNERYHTLKQTNDKLKSDNETLRDRIGMIKNLQQSGLIQVAPEAASANAPVARLKQAKAKTVTAQGSTKPPSAPDGRVPLFQYVLPPAALALRANRDMGLGRQHEESKESMVQPQYVGLERLRPTRFPGAPNLQASQHRMPMMLQGSLANQALSPFTQSQQQVLPQSSIATALLQPQQQARRISIAHAQAQTAQLSPMQQIYQHLLAGQQPQLPLHQQQPTQQQQQLYARLLLGRPLGQQQQQPHHPHDHPPHR